MTESEEIEAIIQMYAKKKKEQTGSSCIMEVELDILKAHYYRIKDNEFRMKLTLERAINENKRRGLFR